MDKKTPRFPWTAKRIKEGRGQGTGKDYLPWIHVREISSKGKSTRLKGWKSGRTIQLLSDIELGFAYLLEWSDSVVDYYEQFSLLPLEETLELGEELGLKQPPDRETGEPHVRTTDFLIELRINGVVRRCVRSVKPASELDVKTKVLGLELERRYWAKRNIDWGIITENELPQGMVRNIAWIHDARDLDDHEYVAGLPLEQVLPKLRSDLEKTSQPLAHACLAVDKQLGLAEGSSLFLVRHQIANKRWRVDMQKEIKTHEWLDLFPEEEADSLSTRGAA